MSEPDAESPDSKLSVKRLRVGLIGEYPVAEDRIQEGGVQSVTYALAHALARRDDVECHIVSAMNGVTTDYRQVGALHVHYVARSRLPRLASLRVYDVPAVVSRIRQIKPDLVHGQAQDRHALAALNSGLPAVITPHGVLFIESRMLRRGAADLLGAFKQYLVNSMEREVFARARDMIIISRYLPQIYGAMLQAQAHFIDNPIGQEFFQIRRTPEAGRLLFVGTVVPRKRVPDLVQALGHVLRRCESTGHSPAWLAGLQLRIAGPLLDPGTEAQVRSAIDSGGLARRVVFLGPISQSQLLDEYARAQLLLLASREETAPQVIAQAMACGLPSVASAVGGIPVMVNNGQSGLLFPMSDTEACAAQIFKLLDDDAGRQAMEQRIVQEARQRFHPDSVAAQTVAVYRQVLARRAGH